MKKAIIFAILFLSGISCFAQTRNVIVNTNGVIISPTNFWSADASNARVGLGINTELFQPASSSLTNLSANNGSGLTNLTAANIVGSVPIAANVSGIVAILNGGTGANTQNGARANLGLGTWSTLSDGAIIRVTDLTVREGSNNDYIQFTATNGVSFFGNRSTQFRQALNLSATWLTNTNVTNFRTDIGLGWSALTNTSLSTFSDEVYGFGNSAVVVDSSNNVISPAGFWSNSPINTILQESFTTTNATNDALNVRNLYLYSLSPTNFGITNTILLPTNGITMSGDVATIIHEGPTNSSTIVRVKGSTNNLITLNQIQEAVKFIYKNGAWIFADNISYIEPIYFSGTNAAFNVAASRTNLGLGATWLTNTNVTNFRTAIGLGTTNNVSFSNITASGTLTSTGIVTAVTNLNVGGTIAVTNTAATRTNLGLGLPVLTNTNNVNFQAGLFQTNSIPTNTANVNGVGFNTAIHWMEVNVVTNGVTNSFRIPLFQ